MPCELASGEGGGGDSPASPLFRLSAFALAALLLLWAPGAMAAVAMVGLRADFSAPSTDLRAAIRLARSSAPKAAVALPSGPRGKATRIELAASRQAPSHVWAVFTLTNPGPRPRALVVRLGRPSIAASGFGPLSAPPAILSVRATAGADIARLGIYTARIIVPARSSASYVMELTSGQIGEARLWQERAFAEGQGRGLLTAGALAGVAVLAALFMLALFVLRHLPMLAGGAVLALGAGGFAAINGGVFELALDHAEVSALWRLAAFCEGLMLAGLSAWLLLRFNLQRHKVLGFLSWGLMALSAGLALWGIFDPRHAAMIIRPALLAVSLAGFAAVMVKWRRGERMDDGVMFVIALMFAWVLIAALLAAGVMTGEGAALAAAVALVVIMVALTMAMIRAALAPSAGLRRFLAGASRRALALSAAGQAVWDLDLVSRRLKVSSELEKQLLLPAGSLADGSAAFMERMHPADVSLYKAAVRAAVKDDDGHVSVQVRLRRADGSYRWYLLRARTMRDDPAASGPSRLIGTLLDVTAIRRSEERMLSDAVRDRITGLPNRPLLMDRLTRSLRRVRETAGALYLIVIDIDRFQGINDAFGFEMGDALLARIARRLRREVEPSDTLARLPGDRFAIILDATEKPRDATAFAARLRDLLARPFDMGAREISLTVSMGIAPLHGHEGPAEELLKNAEVALFEARRRGAASIAFFEPSMADGRSRLATLEQDLRRAVERGEIRVVYQPIMHLASGQLAGFEALVRWRHPVHGLMGADSFIPLAEELGLIGDISRVVLEDAARNLGVWQRAFRPDVPLFVSVNISSVQLLNASLVDEVQEVITHEGIEPHTLKLELTESLILENPELGRKILERIAALGVGIACDDFGTGYSSLSSLRDLPFSTLKTDRSFLDAQEGDERSSIILGNVVRLAHDLGMEVIAEGVETREQMQYLASLGCDMCQGWLVGQPVSARRVTEALSGVSLDTEGRYRFATLRKWFSGKGAEEAEDETGPLVLPTPPLPSATAAATTPAAITPPPAATPMPEETAQQEEAPREPAGEPEREEPEREEPEREEPEREDPENGERAQAEPAEEEAAMPEAEMPAGESRAAEAGPEEEEKEEALEEEPEGAPEKTKSDEEPEEEPQAERPEGDAPAEDANGDDGAGKKREEERKEKKTAASGNGEIGKDGGNDKTGKSSKSGKSGNNGGAKKAKNRERKKKPAKSGKKPARKSGGEK